MKMLSASYTVTVEFHAQDIKDLADIFTLAEMEIQDLAKDKANQSVTGRKKMIERWFGYLKEWNRG